MRSVQRAFLLVGTLAVCVAAAGCSQSTPRTALPGDASTSGAPATTTSASSATASATASSRPTFNFPSDTKVSFEGLPTDAATAAIVRDWKIAQLSYVKAALEGNPKDKVLLQYIQVQQVLHSDLPGCLLSPLGAVSGFWLDGV